MKKRTTKSTYAKSPVSLPPIYNGRQHVGLLINPSSTRHRKISTVHIPLEKESKNVRVYDLNYLSRKQKRCITKQKSGKKHVVTEAQIVDETDQEEIEGSVDNMVRLQREIQRKLFIISKEKENSRRVKKNNWKSTLQKTSDQLFTAGYNDKTKREANKVRSKCELFQSINEIINKKSRKCSTQAAEESVSSLKLLSPLGKSYVYDNLISDDKRLQYTCQSKQLLHEMQRDMSLKPINIKNEGNYKEWRKLSIELISNPKDSYEPTSYQKETSRLQILCCKNANSLRKYLQAKSYLNRLQRIGEPSLTEKQNNCRVADK